MALNKTINGFVYLDDGTKAMSSVKYQAFFYRNGTASSPDKWNSVRLCEDSGYWSFNLGDSDFITQDGLALTNSKVVIVFWKGNTFDRNADCSVLEQWGATEVTITSSDVYIIDVQVRNNSSPNLVWSFPNIGFVNQIYSSSNSSYDVNYWYFGSTLMYHWYSRYGQLIQNINSIITTSYFWGDATYSLDLAGVAIGSHSWDSPGDKIVTAVIEDGCGTTVTGTRTISIFYDEPVPSIICHQGDVVTTPNTQVTFKYDGTNDNNTITKIVWTINDEGYSTEYTSYNVDEVINHVNGVGTTWYNQSNVVGAFSNPGDHIINIDVYWYDGYSTNIISYQKIITQSKFNGPILSFEQEPAEIVLGDLVILSNSTTNTSRVGTGTYNNKFDWEIVSSNTLNIDDVNLEYEVNITPDNDNYSVSLCANWNDGWEDRITCITKSLIFKPDMYIQTEDCFYNVYLLGTTPNGSVSAYSFEVYKDLSDANDGSGPWDLIWSSPIDINQNNKKLCFTSLGYYKIVGYIHGDTDTISLFKLQEISVVCPTEAYDYIWNGTGSLDFYGDWDHLGHGTEESYAKHSGTNGLHVNNNNANFKFDSKSISNITDFDILSFWINVRSWESGKNLELYLTNQGENINGVVINVNNYIITTFPNEWQRVLIPLDDFALDSFNVRALNFNSKGSIDIYLDDIMFIIGAIVTKTIAIQNPTIESHELGEKIITSREFKPSMKVNPTTRSFPGPINL